MNIKNKIKKELILRVENDLKKAKEAAQSSKELSRNGDLKSDGKYDTRAIEAGYLAGAQEKRVQELEQEIKLLEEISFTTLNEKVCIGSIVTLEFNNIQKQYFISSTAGGTILKIDNQVVLVISAFSPIGDGCLNLEVGDEFEIEVGQDYRLYKVQAIS